MTVAVVAAVVAVAVLLVVVPGGGEPSAVVRAPLAPPEATSAPAPTSTVAPTATPTPTATATPPPTATPTPTTAAAPGACAGSTLGVDPASEAGLAADCATLLAAKDELRGTAALDWSADTGMESWDGVSLEGTPSRVTGLNLEGRMLAGSIPAGLGSLAGLRTLDLTGNQLTGAIPPELGGLRALTHVYLSGNALTGCVPRALRAVASNDIATLDLESCALPSVTLSYDTYDTTGAVTTAGSYAFLTEGDDGTTSAVTTYEGLRDGTTTALLIHKSDADETSRSDVYDDVETGDIFEWKEADDCFVRYTVTEVKADPAGTVPRKSLGVELIAYAFTGCSGAIATGSASGSAADAASSKAVSVTWGALPNLGGTSLTAPIVQGPFQLVPAGWTGATKPVGPRFPAGPSIPEAATTSLAEARTFPHWREPKLPEGWTFTYAKSGDESEVGYFEANYDGFRLTVSASGIVAKYWQAAASETYSSGSQTSVRETLQIAGRPARVHHGITERQFRVTVHVWDEATGVLYVLRGSPDMATLIAFAESMFE